MTEFPPTGSSHPVILFDGVCNLCNRGVTFVIDHDRRGLFRFASLQSEVAARLLAAVGWKGDPGALDSVLLIDGGHVFDRSTAVLRVLRELGGRWRWIARLELVPRVLRDALYRWVAGRRYRWFGRSPSCRVPTPELSSRFLT
jgi:predicted DCC family thiol-disulfide oxidoreductase YuxK